MSNQDNKQVAHLAAPQQSQSDRFTQAVMKEFSTTAGNVSVTPHQRKLIQNYFIKLDMTLKANEVKRLGTKEEYRDDLEFNWNNVNMQQLALDVVSYSSVGLDPLQPNHINLIPYKNGKTRKFDIGFIIGYNGTEIKAKKYGFNPPDNVIIEVVRANDKFKPYKKDKDNPIETYTFDIGNGFDRGDIIGGFYFHEYSDAPQKNKLEIFTLYDIDKRKPKHASAEFWGGEKDKWEKGKKVGTEKVEGWYEEMVWKTIKRAAYNDIAIDSEKIDEHLVKMLQTPDEAAYNKVETAVAHEIKENANKQQLNIDEPPVNLQYAEEVKETIPVGTTPDNQANNNQPAATTSTTNPKLDF